MKLADQLIATSKAVNERRLAAINDEARHHIQQISDMLMKAAEQGRTSCHPTFSISGKVNSSEHEAVVVRIMEHFRAEGLGITRDRGGGLDFSWSAAPDGHTVPSRGAP